MDLFAHNRLYNISIVLMGYFIAYQLFLLLINLSKLLSLLIEFSFPSESLLCCIIVRIRCKSTSLGWPADVETTGWLMASGNNLQKPVH